MNCLGKKIYRQKVAEDVFITTARMFINFVDSSIGKILHEECKFGKDRLIGYFNNSYKLITEYINKYSDDKAGDRDDVDIANFVFIRDLSTIGVDFNSLKKQALERRVDRFTCGKSDKKARRMYGQRKEYVKFAEMPFDAVYSGTLVYLHNEYGMGEKKLTKLYERMSNEYNLFTTAYLLCNSVGDAICMNTIKDNQNVLSGCGVPFRKDEQAK